MEHGEARCRRALRMNGDVVRCVLGADHGDGHEGELPRGEKYDRILWSPGHDHEQDADEGEDDAP